MTDKEEIRNIIELFIAWNGETEVIDISNIDSAVDFINDSLQEEPVSEDLEETSQKQKDLIYPVPLEDDFDDPCFSLSSDNKSKRIGFDKGFKVGAQWQKEKMIIKVCKWFNDNACNYFGHMPTYPFIDDLKQAMKDE